MSQNVLLDSTGLKYNYNKNTTYDNVQGIAKAVHNKIFITLKTYVKNDEEKHKKLGEDLQRWPLIMIKAIKGS